MKAHIYDMLILGGGPGGYAAALYAAQAGLDVLVLEKLAAGGQMALTGTIDNYPGFENGIDGFELGEKMQKGAERFGAKTVLAEILSADLNATPKAVHTSEGAFYGKTVVVATGANPRALGLPGEKELSGRGIHYCAMCDGMRYRGKTVAVVGGGNSAAADALLLSRTAKKVILIHRRDALRADKTSAERLRQAENVELLLSNRVTALHRNGGFAGITVQDTAGQKQMLDVDGVFVCVGREPATALFVGQLALDDGGYVAADETTRTNIPGVFAVGDVRTKALRQVVTAVADGAAAAHFAEAYLGE